MGRFINPFTDIGFKKLFGQDIHKDLLISFLNDLLSGEKVISDVKYLDKEILPEFEGDRSTIFDIYCTTEKGEHFIVEMQNRQQQFFIDRAVYYLSRSITRQGEKGVAWKFDLKAVYGVFFMNFSLEEVLTRKFRTDAVLEDRDSHRCISDKMRMIFLQLPEFNISEKDCKTDFERWIYILKHMEGLQRLPFQSRNAVFKRLEQIMDIASLSKEERLKYDATIDAYRNNLAVIGYAEQKGLKKGILQGLQQGRKEGLQQGLQQGRELEKIENARKLKQIGVAVDDICKALGLSKTDVEKL